MIASSVQSIGRMTGCLWRLGDLGVLRGVAGGVAEEARTRGFASLAFASYAFIDIASLFVL